MGDTLIEILDENPENQECVICLDTIIDKKNIWICPQCNIKIHKCCVKKLLKKECPHCRFIFTENINNSLSEYSSDITLSNIANNQIIIINSYIRYRALILCIVLFSFLCCIPLCLLAIPIFLIEQNKYLNFSSYD